MSELKKDNGKQPLFKKIFGNTSYCWLAAFCTVGVMMLVYYCYDLFPFGEATILRMDLYHQYGPLFAEFYDRVTNLKSFLYSWQTGLGSPFLGNYFNYLSSPSAIIILILGHKNMPESIAGMIIAKAALSAFTFTYYLKKSQNKHDFTTAAFGVLYSMCGYFIAYYWNVMWIDAMVYFPLVILGIENIINKRNARCYIPFLALTLLSNYYMGYMTCIFSVVYFIFYYLANNDISSLDKGTPFTVNENGQKKYKLKDRIKGSILLKSGFTFAFASIAAACLVAFALIPTYFILKNCSATSGTFPSEYKSYFSIFDFLANHISSVVPTIRSSGSDVLPNVFCGIGTVILVPLFLFTRTISLKEKVATTGLLAFLFFSFNVNYLNYIWHGFHYPNDLPYRFSFMYSFVLLVMAYKAFTRLKEFTGRQILGAGLSVLVAVIMFQEIGSKNVQEITVLITIVFIVTYTIVFALMKDERYQKSAVSVLLLCCVIGEMACANTDRYSMDQLKSNYVGDYDDFRAVKKALDEKEGNDMYRMDLTYNRARMDPAWFGYNGVSTFSSMAYEKVANLQSDLGIYGNYINSYTYHLQTPVYNMMHALKYVVDNDPAVNVETDYYTQLFGEGKFEAYENNYYLPIGFAVDPDVKEWYTGYNNPFTVQSEWLEYATGVTDVYGMMNIDDIIYYNVDPITSGLESGDIYYTKGMGDGELTFKLTTDETKHCYLYVNSSSFDSINITIHDEAKIQYTDEPYIYDLGIVKPDEEISVYIELNKNTDTDYGYMDFYPFFVNEDKLDEGYAILDSQKLDVTSFEETKITGTIKTDKDSLFYTSIPYDTGWTVKIDGKEIDKESYFALAEAYLCFDLPSGEHTIELSFMPKGLKLGAIVSAVTVVLLIAVAIFFSQRKKKAVLNPTPVIPEMVEDSFSDNIEVEVIEVENAEPSVSDEPHEEAGEAFEEISNAASKDVANAEENDAPESVENSSDEDVETENIVQEASEENAISEVSESIEGEEEISIFDETDDSEE